MNLHRLLAKRDEDGRPVRIGVIGAGKFATMYLAQARHTPGMHVPVLSSEAIAERRPDFLVILAWNFARPIMAKNAAFTEAGGRFIIPLPQVEMV